MAWRLLPVIVELSCARSAPFEQAGSRMHATCAVSADVAAAPPDTFFFFFFSTTIDRDRDMFCTTPATQYVSSSLR